MRADTECIVLAEPAASVLMDLKHCVSRQLGPQKESRQHVCQAEMIWIGKSSASKRKHVTQDVGT